MKKIEKIVNDYCIGCGLCKSVFPNDVDYHLGEDGFYHFSLLSNNKFYTSFKKICPLFTNSISPNIWGEYKDVCLGYSMNSDIRKKGSSGGVLTQLCISLVEEQIVDGIIHIGFDGSSLLPISKISYCANEIEANIGSKYIIVTPLLNIVESLEQNINQKFIIIGRPCDIRAMRNFLKEYPKYQKQIYCMLSFFCAGTPSYNATLQIFDHFRILKDDVLSITYRGFGWPGYTTITDRNGKKYTMSYEDSWGKILGRDIYKGCRFCPEGTGESADISVCDAWYLDDNRNVVFTENNGRNVIFARTERGNEVLSKVKFMNKLYTENFDVSNLKYIQQYQYQRKSLLYTKLTAMRLAFRIIPVLNMRIFKNLNRNIIYFERLKYLFGTFTRIMRGII